MITIQDFKKGNKAFILLMNRGRNSEPTVKEVKIQSVGRTYVTIGQGAFSKRYQNWNSEYLYEKVDYGESTLLFKTKEDVENYIEKCDLALWLGCLSVTKAESYSLEQLRKVKGILENK